MTAWQALTCRGFLVSGWPWRSVAYLATTAPLGVVTAVTLSALLTAGAVLTVTLVGIPILAAAALSGLPVAALERHRLRLIDTEVTGNPHRPPARTGLRFWLSTRFREQATWRELAYTVLLATVLWPVSVATVVLAVVVPAVLLAAPAIAALDPHGRAISLGPWQVNTVGKAWLLLPLGAVLLILSAYLVTLVAAGHGTLARSLLAAREAELGQRIVELTQSRVRLIDAFTSERRRIERDLHDGAQQRLVSLSMTLGLARLDLPPGPTTDLVARAHEQATLALAELRELIHGIHPQVLTDRGLPAAVADVAGRSPIPVDVAVNLPRRLPEPVEATAYFVVCEALTNVAKHSRARRAWVTARLDQDSLIVEIRDDGAGGAGGAGGADTGGLAGLADRVSAVGGTLTLCSPPGGPTVIRTELPCTPMPEPG